MRFLQFFQKKSNFYGNLTLDPRNRLEIQNNVLNLPMRVSTMGSTMTYTYLGDGTKLQDPNLRTQAANRWRYAGKEEQDIAGMDLGLLDFGARFYDPFTCRWNAVDPLAHKYFGLSPYNYCGNDPVNRFDPDGREVKPLGEEELEVIRNTLPKEARWRPFVIFTIWKNC